MNWGEGYNKPEIVSIMEQLHEKKGQLEAAQLQLSSEEFHSKYIPKRKNLIFDEALVSGILIVVLSLVVIPSLIVFISISTSPEEASGNTGLLAYMFIIAFGGYADVRLCIREWQLLLLLYASFSETRALRFSSKFQVDTLQSDEIKTKKRIEFLKEQIANYEASIHKLEEKKTQYFEEQQRKEAVLREKGVLFDEDPKKAEIRSKFNLKEDIAAYDNSAELFEYYCKEETYINNVLFRLEGKIGKVEKKIVQIDENFATTKKQIFISFCAFVLIAIVQSSFHGVLAIVTNMLCFVFGLFFIFYFEKKCRQSILLYLIEHDSPLTSEYAFCNSIYPVKYEREELLEQKEQLQKELVTVKEEKAKL